MPGDRARKAGSEARRQASGTYRNARDFVGSFAFDRILPNGIAGFITELLNLVPYALGRGSARKQIFASTTLIIIAFLSTPFTFGYSLALAVPFIATLVWGFLRLVPLLNTRFKQLRNDHLRDRDVPLWTRE